MNVNVTIHTDVLWIISKPMFCGWTTCHQTQEFDGFDTFRKHLYSHFHFDERMQHDEEVAVMDVSLGECLCGFKATGTGWVDHILSGDCTYYHPHVDDEEATDTA